MQNDEWDQAIRAGEELAKIQESKDDDALPPSTQAETHIRLGLAYAKRSEYALALKQLRAANSLDPSAAPWLELVDSYVDQLSPSPQALATATDVTGREDILRQAGIDVGMDGVVSLARPHRFDEVRGRIMKILDRRDVLLEYTDLRTTERRLLLFPFGTFETVSRGVECEWLAPRYLSHYGFDKGTFAHKLAEDPNFGQGYCAYFLTTSQNMLFGASWHASATYQTTQYSHDEFPNTVENVIRMWRKQDELGQHYRVPYTWTRPFAAVIRGGNDANDPDFMIAGAAYDVINLPIDDTPPYPLVKEGSLLWWTTDISSYGQTFKAAHLKAQAVNTGLPAHAAKTNSLIELGTLYQRMTPEERRDFRDKSLRVARGIQLLASHVKETPFTSSVKRASSISPEPTVTPFSVTVRITRNGKPLEDRAIVKFYMGVNKYFEKDAVQESGAGEWKLSVFTTYNDLGVRVNDKEVFTGRITKPEYIEINL